jgi:hypothetical protein
MIPAGIYLGRAYDAFVSEVTLFDGDNVQILAADSNRLVLSFAPGSLGFSVAGLRVAVGVRIDGFTVPLAVLTQTNPTAKFTFDEFGSIICQEWWASNQSGDNLNISIANIRLTGPVPIA